MLSKLIDKVNDDFCRERHVGDKKATPVTGIDEVIHKIHFCPISEQKSPNNLLAKQLLKINCIPTRLKSTQTKSEFWTSPNQLGLFYLAETKLETGNNGFETGSNRKWPETAGSDRKGSELVQEFIFWNAKT